MASRSETIGSANLSKSWADFNDEETRKLKARAEGIVRMHDLMNQLDGDTTVKAAFKEEFRVWRTGMLKSLSDMKGNTECAYLNLLEAEKKAEALQTELDALKKRQSSPGQKQGAMKDAATENTKTKLMQRYEEALRQRTASVKEKYAREMSERLQNQQKKLEDAENMHARELESLQNRSKTILEDYQSELTGKNRELEAQKTFVDEAKKHITGLDKAIANQATQIKLLHIIRLRNLERLQVLNEVINTYSKENIEKDSKIALLSKDKAAFADGIITLKTIISDLKKELETLKQQSYADHDKLMNFQSLEKELETMKEQAHAQHEELITFQSLEKDRDALRNAIAAYEQKIEDRNAEIAALREEDNAHQTQIADLVSENRNLKSRATEFTNQATWIDHHKEHVALVVRVRNLNIEIARVRQEGKTPVPQGIHRIDQHKEGWILSGKIQELLKTLFGSNLDFVATHFNRAHSGTGGLGERVTTPQQQLPLRQGRNSADNEVALSKKHRIVDGTSRAIPADQKGDKQQADVNFNKTVLTSRPLADARGIWATGDKQEQTNRDPTTSKRHASPKGAEDPKRAKVSGHGQGFSSQQEEAPKDEEICLADQRGECHDKNCPKLHRDERFVKDA